MGLALSKKQFKKPKSIQKTLDKINLIFPKIDFFDFARNAIVERENLKFEFIHKLNLFFIFSFYFK